MRRWLLTACCCVCLLPAAVAAQGIADSVVDQLRAQGYSQFTVESTFLGRLRIVATGGTRWREIVVNPQTGEIVRDYSRSLSDDGSGTPRIFWDDVDDDDRPDRRDADDDEDRSDRGGAEDDDGADDRPGRRGDDGDARSGDDADEPSGEDEDRDDA